MHEEINSHKLLARHIVPEPVLATQDELQMSLATEGEFIKFRDSSIFAYFFK
jgi:hypothetical protein